MELFKKYLLSATSCCQALFRVGTWENKALWLSHVRRELTGPFLGVPVFNCLCLKKQVFKVPFRAFQIATSSEFNFLRCPQKLSGTKAFIMIYHEVKKVLWEASLSHPEMTRLYHYGGR